ncbi:hypothetical protein AMTRI_Chr05g71890 [Amborella trichopoda]|uniref:Uncharacterized protein n=1 Tax=Amborella trichopoda TaxID=13333 RepID=W1NXM0_AMBTC|nr:hypothetical protein AMTR_s00104p00147760 [Amborella trichopoda]
MAMVDDEDTLKRSVENARAITIGLFTASFPSAGLSWLIKNQNQKAAFLLLLFGCCILLSGQALGLITYGLCKNETFHLVEQRMYSSIVLFIVAIVIFICSQVSMVAVAPVVVALIGTPRVSFLGYCWCKMRS